MKRHYLIKVEGLVQGVFYRKYTQLKANELSLSGFVINQEDGSVYIEAEGDEKQLKELVLWCHQGPDRAKVTNVEVTETELAGFMGFEVRR